MLNFHSTFHSDNTFVQAQNISLEWLSSENSTCPLLNLKWKLIETVIGHKWWDSLKKMLVGATTITSYSIYVNNVFTLNNRYKD